MIVAALRNNRVYKAVKELYEMELPHEVRAERIGQALDELNPCHEELKDYNSYFGIRKSVAHTGAHMTSVTHPSGERIIITRYAAGEIGEDGESGLLTIEGRRSKNPDPFYDLKQDTILEAIRRVRAETFLTQFEKDTILDALCEFDF